MILLTLFSFRVWGVFCKPRWQSMAGVAQTLTAFWCSLFSFVCHRFTSPRIPIFFEQFNRFWKNVKTGFNRELS